MTLAGGSDLSWFKRSHGVAFCRNDFTRNPATPPGSDKSPLRYLPLVVPGSIWVSYRTIHVPAGCSQPDDALSRSQLPSPARGSQVRRSRAGAACKCSALLARAAAASVTFTPLAQLP